MSKKLILFSFLFLNIDCSQAQTFRTNLITSDTTATGFLSDISDTSVKLSQHSVKFRQSILKDNTAKNYNYHDIENITITKKGTIVKSILIGTVAGAFLGYLDTKSVYGPSYRAFAGSLSGMLIGAITGLITSNKTFNIYHKKENFKKMKASVLKMSYIKN